MAVHLRHGERSKILFRRLAIQPLNKTTITIQQISPLRCLHGSSTALGRCRLISQTAGSYGHLLGKHGLGMCSVQQQLSQRFKSTESAQYIPEAPPMPALEPEPLPDVSHMLNELGEPTLSSLGLCDTTPGGLVQMALEMLHVDCGLPWYGAILVGTIILRSFMIPVNIIAQRNSAKAFNYMPLFTAAQQKMQRAKSLNNKEIYYEAAMQIHELKSMKKFNPLHVMIAPMIQAPIFLSVFSGLRGMANLPVESLATGGFLWMTNLTIPDPYYILPVITSLTLLVTLEVGSDTQSTQSASTNMKYVMRAMPFVALPFIANMPAAMCVYWCTANFFSLTVVSLLQIPGFKDFLGIEKLVKHPEAIKPSSQGFIKDMKTNWKKTKAEKDLSMRRKIDEDNFRKAGQGPIPKTYSYNPKTAKSPNSSDTKVDKKL